MKCIQVSNLKVLTKFHNNLAINEASIVDTSFFYLNQFHKDWAINVITSLLTSSINAASRSHNKHLSTTDRQKDIIWTNLLTKFHEDRKINLVSRMLTRKNAPPPGSHFHENLTVNVASREKFPPRFSHVFQANVTIFKLIQDIIGTNLLTKFREDRKINVASRVLTRFYYSHIWKNAPPSGGHVFQPTSIIFELVQDIIGVNLLTKFYEDWTINVASRVKNAPPLGSHVFQAKICLGNDLLTKFHEDRKINVASRVLTGKMPRPLGACFSTNRNHFKLVQDIIGMNLLTKFHENRTINVASRVKNAPPLSSHVFQANLTIFEIIQDIIKTNLLIKVHEDWTINVTSRVLTRQMLMPDDARRTMDKRRSQKLTMSTLCSGELKIL
ncbi:hypothetical protein DPMN_102937 [Dreissena polymorpha]|uniref:Uncharacterized protein n=1 Tax=Dreissena polymorpha TaxID=45954 RepID=A0A9D4HA79_DREPO|nr:hypothetical protein DPMN_102937 [Dreissena polymorpha]